MIDPDDIAPSFLFVLSRGFVPSASDNGPEEFGNAALVMAGVPFSLRFVRDRGQIFVDARSSITGWHKLEYVLEFVDASVTQEQLGEPPDPEIMASLLRINWDKIASIFIDRKISSRLEIFSKEKSAKFLAKISRKS